MKFGREPEHDDFAVRTEDLTRSYGAGDNQVRGCRRAFDRERDCVLGNGSDRKIIGHGQRSARGVIRPENIVHVNRVELAVLQLRLDGHRLGLVPGDRETVVDHLPGARRA